MGEVRKRKSSEEKSNGAENAVIVSEAGGLGLIPVVLIAAILAGSGCYVIKKDHAESFSDIQQLTSQLKSDNAKTLKAVDAMKKSIEQKDLIIKELQQKVNAGNEKNRLTDEKLDDVVTRISESTDSASSRQKQIELLEQALADTKTSTASQTAELKRLVEDSSADDAAMEVQTAQLNEVTGQISSLNAKIQEGATKIAQLNAETVEINAKIEQVGQDVKSVGATVEEIKNAGGAGIDELKKTFDAEIAAFSEQLEVVEGTIPSEAQIMSLQTTASKTADRLDAALKNFDDSSAEIKTFKAQVDKEFAEFGAKIAAVADDVKSGRSSVSGLTSSVENAEKMIEALNKDFQGLKKKIAAK